MNDHPGEGATHFASATRASPAELEHAVKLAADSEVVGSLLTASAAMLVVLNADRQIVALNDSWLERVGASGVADLLGLRIGEAIGCVHAEDAPSGCGTALGCRRCGAVIAILASQANSGPHDEDCVLSVKTERGIVDLILRVRASPMPIDGVAFTLVSMQDVTVDRQRRVLERAFYHDVGNMVMGLMGSAARLEFDPPATWGAAAHDVKLLARKLAEEIAIQRTLAADDLAGAYRMSMASTTLVEVLASVKRVVANHPVGARRSVTVDPDSGPMYSDIETDRCLLERCLMNLVLNALEATPAQGLIRIGCRLVADHVEFTVWNAGTVPEDVRPRLFRRYFTTKNGAGRGQGLFAVKVFCEQYLRGTISYTTSEADGTTFVLRLPRGPRPSGANSH